MINSDREGDQHVKVDAFACRCLLPDLMSQLGNNSQETKYLAYDLRCADNIVRVFVTHSRLSAASQSFCFPQPTCAARARLFSRQRHVLPPWHNLKIILPWLLPHSSFPLLPSEMIKLNPRDLPHGIASAIQSKRSETKKDLDLIVKIGIWLKYCRVSIALYWTGEVKKFTNSHHFWIEGKHLAQPRHSYVQTSSRLSVYDSLWMNTGKPKDCVLQSRSTKAKYFDCNGLMNWSIVVKSTVWVWIKPFRIKVWDPVTWNHLFGRMKKWLYKAPEALYKENRVRFNTSFRHGRQNLPAAPARDNAHL